MDSQAIEDGGHTEGEELKVSTNSWDQIKVPGLRTSMSMNDLVNHIGHCISEQMTSGNPFFSPEGEGSRSRDMLDEITHYLLSDSQFSSASDEQSLMSRVNSLCSLLQKDAATVQHLQIKSEDELNDELTFNPRPREEIKLNAGDVPSASDGELRNDVSACKQQQPSAMSRKDSVGDLLLHLPRIASYPFLFNISEDGDNQAR